MIPHLKVIDWLGIKAVDVACPWVTLFAGANEAGKSSLQNAIRFALTGEIGRTTLKKGDYGMLVREGAKKASLAVGNVTLTLTAAGKVTANGSVDSIFSPFVLDPHRFASLDATERRRALSHLVDIDRDAVAHAARQRGADDALVDEIMPLLRAGFEAAHDEAEDRAKAARGAWKMVTQENYGSEKAEGWEPPAVAGVAGDRAKLVDLVDRALKELVEFRVHLVELHQQVGLLEAEIRCPECKHQFHLPGDLGDARAAAKNAEQSVPLLERAFANRQRDLANHDAAVTAAEEAAKAREGRITAAAQAHADVQKWTTVRALCAPDGIPSILIEPVLEQVNERLQWSAGVTGWPVVQVRADMEILYGPRPYALCSESAQWRADAMLADAIGHAAHDYDILLDRVDVLDMQGRAELIEWALQRGQQERQTIMFATLKQPPEIDGVTAYWLERGEVTPAA